MCSTLTGTAIVAVVWLLCALLTVTGFQFYEDGMDSIAQTFLSDLLVDGAPVTSFATGKWLLIDRLLIFLGGVFPKVDWYGAVMLLLSGVVAAMLFRVFGISASANTERTGAPFQLLVFGLALLFLENLVLVQYTRVAYFICFLPMVLAFIRLRNGIVPTRVQLLAGGACFIVGALIRMEAAALAIFMMAPLLVFVRPKGMGFISTGIRMLLLPLAVVAGVSALMLYPSELDDDIRLHNRFLHNADGLRYEPAQLGITDRSDSLAYEVTLSYFMNDPLYINDGLVKRAGIMPMTSAGAIASHFGGFERFGQRVRRYVPHYVDRHWGLLLFVLCCFMYAMMFPNSASDRRSLLLLFLSYAVLAILIAGYIKIEDRVFNPMVLTWAATALVLCNRDGKAGKAFSSAVALLVTVSVSAEAWVLKSTIAEKRVIERSVNQLMEYVSIDTGQLVVIDAKMMTQLHYAPFRSLSLPEGREYFSIDNGILFLYPGYEARALRLFGTADTGGIMAQLSTYSDSCLLLSSRFRARRVTEYFNIQHGLSLRVKPIYAADGNTELESGSPNGLIAYVLETN
jgi:hypothetical protein